MRKLGIATKYNILCLYDTDNSSVDIDKLFQQIQAGKHENMLPVVYQKDNDVVRLIVVVHTQQVKRHQGMQLPQAHKRTHAQQHTRMLNVQLHSQLLQAQQPMQISQLHQHLQPTLPRPAQQCMQLHHQMPKHSAQMRALPHAPQLVSSLHVAELPWFSKLQGGLQEVLLGGQHGDKQGGL